MSVAGGDAASRAIVAAMPTPAPPAVQAILDALAHVGVSASVDIPALTALFDLLKLTRETMSQANRDRADALMLDWQEHIHAVEMAIWQAVGLPQPPAKGA